MYAKKFSLPSKNGAKKHKKIDEYSDLLGI